MTEITRVPLQPIQKGSLLKLWLGIAAVALVAGGLAWSASPGTVRVTELTAGTGGSPIMEDVVLVNYVGKLENGKMFDQGQQAPLPLHAMIPGFAEGLLEMKKGGKYRLEIPAAKGYGAEAKFNPQTGEVVIPGNSNLVFEIELVDFMSRQDFDQRMQAMQQMQQMMETQQKGGGAPVPPPPGVPGH